VTLRVWELPEWIRRTSWPRRYSFHQRRDVERTFRPAKVGGC
jgi:hypothetical protein